MFQHKINQINHTSMPILDAYSISDINSRRETIRLQITQNFR